MRSRAATAALVVVALAAAAAVVSGAGTAEAVSGPVEIGGVRPLDVDISGDRVVFADRAYGDYDIFLYDASEGELRRLTTDASDQIQPTISGDVVVWVDYRDGDADLWMYDLLTDSASQLINVANDQVNPSLDGSWLVWEDYRSGYSPAIYGMDLAAPVVGGFRIASGYNAPMNRPVVGDGFVVWEDRSDQAVGRGDPDIVGADLTSFNPASPQYVDIAVTPGVSERAPFTDGRYVVWSADAEGGADVYAYDIATQETVVLSDADGEQSQPVVADGVAYWLNNVEDERLHYRKHDFATGRDGVLNTYGSGDVAGLAADGANAAWVESTGGEWRVKAVFNEAPESALTTLVKSVALRAAWVPARIAQLFTAGDSEPPAVVDATVEPGQTQVDLDAPLAVYFSEELDPATVNEDTVALIDEETGEPVAADVTYSALTDSVQVEPAQPLDEGTYTLSVSAHVTDEAGNPLPEGFLTTFSSFVTFNADTSPPSKPGLRDIRVSGLTDVELTWTASRDNVGVTSYRIYRYGEPISDATKGLAELVDTVPGTQTSATVSTAVDEDTPRKYTYYYVVTAVDAQNNESRVSANMTPDPHGTYVFGKNTNNCGMCHSVHGTTSGRAALNAKSAEACYECHGDTEGTSAYGYASTIDIEYDFYDDSGDPGRSTAVRHRTDYAMATQQECDMCHTPHRKPANVDAFGTKDDATSYSKLLKKPSDASKTATDPAQTYTYSSDAAPFGNDLCFTCHGAQSAYMNSRGGDTAYSDAGGNHQATFDSGAHGSSMILSSTRPADDPGPNPTCYACHNEHATQTQGLTDWRQSGVRDGTYNQAGLCFACHSANYTNETRTNSSNQYFAWNARNVQAEFGRTSSHPYQAAANTQTVQTGTWSQTTEAEFDTDTLVRTDTTPTGDGSVVLASIGGGGSSNQTLFSDDWDTTQDMSRWDTVSNWAATNASGHNSTWSSRHTATGTHDIRVAVDTTGASNMQVEFWIQGNTLTENADYFRLYFKDNNGTWRQVWNKTLEDQNTAWEQHVVSIDEGTYGPFGPNTEIRFEEQVSQSGEQQFLDDVVLTADVPSGGGGGYQPEGTVTSTLISASGGNLQGWGQLTYNGSEPVDTTITVDVLNGADESPIAGFQDLRLGNSPVDLSTIDHNLYPTLKLRAELYGDSYGSSPVPQTVSDDFDDNSFDTTLWTDVPTLGGADDPDAGGTDQVFYSDGNSWTGIAIHEGRWKIKNGAFRARDRDNNNPDRLRTTTLDMSSYTGGEVEYRLRRKDDDGLTLRVRWYNGSTWRTLATYTNRDDTWRTYTHTLDAADMGAGSYLQFEYDSTGGNSEIFVDDIYVRGTRPATNDWPSESGQQLTLRAEGADFWNTNDEGDFVYTSSEAHAFYASGGWEAVTKVDSAVWQNAWGKAGLMVRAGGSVANATAGNAKMVGLYITRDNGVSLQYRASAGANSVNAGNAAGQHEPIWLKLVYDGSGGFTGWYSSDGSNWTQVGGAVSVSMDAKILVGLALTSHVNGTFAEATFDDFSVTEAVSVVPSTKTPSLDDWTVTYSYLPVVTGTGQLTCANCHNTHVVQTGSGAWDVNRVADPNNTKNIWTGTMTAFCLRCHDSDGGPTAQMSANSVVPYSVGFTDYSSKPFFPGWDKMTTGADWASSRHNAVGAVSGCETCHDPHGSDFDRLTAYTGGAYTRANTNASVSKEQNLCYSQSGCHAGGTNSRSVGTAFSQTYAHPITTDDRHSDLEEAADFAAGSTRHVECVDCHDPHAARAGTHTYGSSVAGEVLRGAIGVKPTWSSTRWTAPTGFTPVRIKPGSGDDYEAYLCFKCHSSYTTLPTSGGSGGFGGTDLALEFNPANDSGHNVMGNVWPKTSGLGPNNRTWTLPPQGNILRSGLTYNSTVTCSDCHTWSGAGATGPHGSSQPYMIDSAYTTSWLTATLENPGSVICTKCHVTPFDTNNYNDVHGAGDHRRYRCVDCHVKVPHGWKRPRLLGYEDDPAPYASNYLDGITDRDYQYSNWNKDYCGQTGCGEHDNGNPRQGPRWP